MLKHKAAPGDIRDTILARGPNVAYMVHILMTVHAVTENLNISSDSAKDALGRRCLAQWIELYNTSGAGVGEDEFARELSERWRQKYPGLVEFPDFATLYAKRFS